MDAQQFLAEFRHIANASNGVNRLRDLVLDLAIQGRLIVSNESQDAASGLFAEIREWRVNQTHSRKGHRSKVEMPISDSEKPFLIPRHWIWVRNSDIFTLAKGKNPKDLGVKGKYPYLDIEALDRGNIQRYTNDEHVPRTTKTDILVVCDGSRSGLVLDGKDGVIGSTLARIDTFPAIQPFLKLLFLHSYRRLNAEKKGAAIPHLDTAKLLISPCGLPPINDQISIVAKVDELMALCDKLEIQQQARRKLQNALRQSTLQAVPRSQSSHELQTTWTRLADNFGQLFDAPEDLADLRQTILDLAFKGNISEQSDRVTSDLVESLHLRKMQLSAEKRIKRETPVIDFQGITEMLGSIPDQWAWVRLNDIASVVRGGSPRPAGDPKFYGGSIPFLKVADVTAAKGMFVERFTSTITEAGLNKTREISTRTVLLTNSGATLGVPAICEFRTTFNDGIAAFIELNDAVFDEYLYLFLKSKTKWLQDIASRGQGQPNLNTEIIRSMWFPLAPISEQHRIVTRVSELMRFCEVLETNLKHVSVVGKRLAITAISSLTGIAIEQKEEPMKAPQTELIAPLRLGTAPSIKAQAPLATLLARHHGEMSAKDLWLRFGGEIDAFYAQLKTEVAHGWILEPAPAEMREKPADAVGA